MDKLNIFDRYRDFEIAIRSKHDVYTEYEIITLEELYQSFKERLYKERREEFTEALDKVTKQWKSPTEKED